MRALRIAAAALLTLQLPACSFTMNVNDMLAPPRLTVEQEQIYQALKNFAGTDISLKYPKSGSRLSAFTVEDLDGDGADEAIVFYETSRSAADENPLRICLLGQQEDGWTAVDRFPALGAEIERVDVEQLGTNPRRNLIVQYSVVDGSDHAAQIFHYDGEMFNCSLTVPYSVLSIRDLNMDGSMELFAATSAKSPVPAQAVVYELDSAGNYLQTPVLNLPDAFTEMTRLLYGSVSLEEGTVPAVYMDSAVGATTAQTAILVYRDGLLSLAYADAPDRFPNTERPIACAISDIDGDGEIEIPMNTNFYGYSETESGSPLDMTNWYVCRNGRLMRDHASYYAVQEGYVFLIPERWEGYVTAVQQDEDVVFCAFDQTRKEPDGSPVLKEPLLRLSVVTDPIEAEALQLEGYLLLREKNGRFFLARREEQKGSIALSESEIMFALQVL